MDHRPKRALGQHFLVDARVRGRILGFLDLEEGDTVLEIGPGRGALTEGLARKVAGVGGRLVLAELDGSLADALAARFVDDPGVDVLQRDVLGLDPAEVTADPEALRVVGNLPYNITSPVLFHLLRLPRPRDCLLMVQKEVADRILAEPSSRAYGALTVGIRAVAAVERLLRVPPDAFRPRPRVDSSVIRIRPLRPAPLSPEEETGLRELTRALFQWRRKQLGRILRDHPDLGLGPGAAERVAAAGGVRLTDRPEDVPVEGLVAMARLRAGGASS